MTAVQSEAKSYTTPKPSGSGRLFWPDVLRSVSAFAIVFLHVAASRIKMLQPGEPGWWSAVLLRSVPAFAVPVFFMLSGMFFLDPQRDVSWRKILDSCKRLLLACAFWSVVYQFAFPPHSLRLVPSLKGPVHLWFLPAIVTCYLLSPALRSVSSGRTAERTFLVVAFLTGCLLASLRLVSPVLARSLPPSANVSVASFPVFYFVLGNRLAREPFGRTGGTVLAVAATLSFFAMLFICGGLSKTGARPIGLTADQATVTLFSAGVFAGCRRLLSGASPSPAAVWAVGTVSRCSFGVYLVHNAIIRIIPAFSSRIAVDIPARTLAVFAVSLAVTLVLSRIPVLRKVVS